MGWTDAHRKTLDAILDQLIPANRTRGIPGAGELGIADFLASRAAQGDGVRIAIEALLQRACGLAGEVTPALVRQLQTELPGLFEVLLIETYKGYYSRPDMREKVGVGAHPVHPAGYTVAGDAPDLMDALTAPVRARGPVFRDPTGDKA